MYMYIFQALERGGHYITELQGTDGSRGCPWKRPQWRPWEKGNNIFIITLITASLLVIKHKEQVYSNLFLFVPYIGGGAQDVQEKCM